MTLESSKEYPLPVIKAEDIKKIEIQDNLVIFENKEQVVDTEIRQER